MQVRVRVELPDSPGALARLAQVCGEAYVNILSVRAYPALGSVTDDLILEIPDYWSFEDARDLVLGAGGNGVAVIEASRGDLEDEPTRWLLGALSVIEKPEYVDDVVARLMGPVASPVHAEARRIEVLRQFHAVATGGAIDSAFETPDLGAAPRSRGLLAYGATTALTLVRASRRLLGA